MCTASARGGVAHGNRGTLSAAEAGPEETAGRGDARGRGGSPSLAGPVKGLRPEPPFSHSSLLQAPKKKVAAAPSAIKKQAAPAKPTNPLYEKRPKSFGAEGGEAQREEGSSPSQQQQQQEEGMREEPRP